MQADNHKQLTAIINVPQPGQNKPKQSQCRLYTNQFGFSFASQSDILTHRLTLAEIQPNENFNLNLQNWRLV